MKTFKALGVLLAYPTQALLDALPDLFGLVVEESIVPRAQRDRLKAAMQWMAAQDLIDLEEQYVEWFDRGRATSLHLFEHVHGESRDRGQAMVDLKSLYQAQGLHLAGNELPDYLPALLEYLSVIPHDAANEMVADFAHILRGIGAHLTKRHSSYAAIIAAVLAAADEAQFEADTIEPVPEKSMDEEWAEEPVIFGPAAAPGCGSTGRAGRAAGSRTAPG